ncbi:hypothetical protein AB834_05740 [PVC group bacterium (ex Bugula neritina AB1)]|nr:hypothetical protein AB834_05740 [PVC group bacterium (ex Bugula neritina AB1)]
MRTRYQILLNGLLYFTLALSFLQWRSLSKTYDLFDWQEKDFASWQKLERIRPNVYSLKTVSQEDLLNLPSVGPTLAERIVIYQKKHGFASKKDLLKVKGIGAKTYQKIERFFE